MAMKNIRWLTYFIFSILSSSIVLVSCSAPSLPIFIQNVWVSEPPVVGKIVRLGIRLESIGDEGNIIVTMSFPNTVAVIDSPMRWEFGLKDQEEKEIFSDICVLESGAWLIDIGISSFYDNGEMKYGAPGVIGVISSPSQGKVLLEEDITYNQASDTQTSNSEVRKTSVEECSP